MDYPAGAYAPVPTPLDENRRFDPASLAAHLTWLASEGLHGAVVLGTNGEFPSLSLEERRRVAEVAVEAGTGLDLILGVGSCALPEVLEMVDTAAALGYRAVLCPPPFYFRSAPARGVATFFLEVLDRCTLPVLLYHIPQVTGVPISDEVLDCIGEHTGLAGVKDSSGDLTEMKRLTRRFVKRAYLVGNDHLLTACLNSGGSGSITAAASVAPALVESTYRDEAEQGELDRVRSLLEEYGLGPSVKAILRSAGLGEFATRPPLLGLEDERIAELWNTYCQLVPDEHRPRAVKV